MFDGNGNTQVASIWEAFGTGATGVVNGMIAQHLGIHMILDMLCNNTS